MRSVLRTSRRTVARRMSATLNSAQAIHLRPSSRRSSPSSQRPASSTIASKAIKRDHGDLQNLQQQDLVLQTSTLRDKPPSVRARRHCVLDANASFMGNLGQPVLLGQSWIDCLSKRDVIAIRVGDHQRLYRFTIRSLPRPNIQTLQAADFGIQIIDGQGE